MKKEVGAFLNKFKELTEASRVLSRDDQRLVVRYAMALLLFMEGLLLRFIAVHQTDPVLHQYAGDGTPQMARQRRCFQLLGKTFSRSGEGKNEFLLHWVFISAPRHLLAPVVAPFCKIPIPLQGKSAWHIFSARKMFTKGGKTLRQLGHKGICVYMYCWDRALWSAMARFGAKWHCVQLEQVPLNERGDAFLFEWFVTRPCAAHDLHNSFRWGMILFGSPMDITPAVFFWPDTFVIRL